MALENLFEMVKADRYTQDGREAIIKAQEAETEDKVYNIGDISQKTGLQKTANGWVKPKNGKQPEAASKHDTDPQTYIVKKNDELRKMYLNEKDPAKKEAMKKALKKQASMMEPEPFSSTESKPAEETKTKFETEQENAKYEEGKKGWETVSKERLPDIKKKVEQKIDYYKKYDPYAMLGKRTGLNAAQKKAVEQNMAQAKENLAFYTGQLEGINEQMEAANKPAGESKPAAEKSEGRNFRSELEANPKGAYDFAKTIEHSIPMTAGDKEVLSSVKSFMREEGTDYKDALKSVATGLVNGNKLHGDWYPEKEKSLLKIAKAVGMDNEVKSYVKTLAKGYDFGYSEDAAYTAQSINAPREKLERTLTGDTRIRVRK